MKRIKIYDNRWGENEHNVLEVIIDDEGNLNLEGYDIGDFVKEYWGDDDYEYFILVKKENLSTILLWLIKERFKNSSDFMNWLKEKQIPYEFGSWV